MVYTKPEKKRRKKEIGTYCLLCKYTTSYNNVLTRKNNYRYIITEKNYKINHFDHIKFNRIDTVT